MINALDDTAAWARQRQLRLVESVQTGSTNNDAKACAFHDPDEPVLYLTGHQSTGRGRAANQWLDTGAGESLLSTWSFAAPVPPQAITGPRVGLALFHAANHAWPSLQWSLKAPNDLHLDGCKAAGLLIESLTHGPRNRLLIGLGFNVTNHPRRFQAATHLSAALGRAPDAGEWFNFLDELKQQFTAAAADCLRPDLSAGVRAELKNALNANPARPFAVTDVSPRGDLAHAGGTVKWTDL